jgi:hypothetical protein
MNTFEPLTADTLRSLYEQHSRHLHRADIYDRISGCARIGIIVGVISMVTAFVAHGVTAALGNNPFPAVTYLIIGGATIGGVALRIGTEWLSAHAYERAGALIVPHMAAQYHILDSDRTQPLTASELEQFDHCLTDLAVEHAHITRQETRRRYYPAALHEDTRRFRRYLQIATLNRALPATVSGDQIWYLYNGLGDRANTGLHQMARYWPLTGHAGDTLDGTWNIVSHRLDTKNSDPGLEYYTAVIELLDDTERSYSPDVLATAVTLAGDDPDHNHSYTDLIGTAVALTPQPTS